MSYNSFVPKNLRKDGYMSKTFAGGIKFRRKKLKNNKIIPAVCNKVTFVLDKDDKAEISDGQSIKKYALIRKSSPEREALFASISGKAQIENDGDKTIITINAEEDTADAEFTPLSKPINDYTAVQLRDALSDKGIRINEAGTEAKVLTVDCTCSPLNHTKDLLCRLYAEKTVGGAKVLMKIFGAVKCIFAIPSSCLEAAQSIEKCLLAKKSMIKISLIKDKYPSREHLTVCASSGIEITPSKELEKAGYPTVSPNLCLSVFRALAEGVPYCEDYLTVNDNGESKVMLCPLGANVKNLADGKAPLFYAEAPFGTPVSENSLFSSQIQAVTTAKPAKDKKQNNCIGCGRCVDICVGRLTPYRLYANSKKISEAMKNELLSCFECGCCSLVCPSRLPLYETFAVLKHGSECGEQDERHDIEKREDEIPQELTFENKGGEKSDLNAIFAENGEDGTNE